jgi:hypothetical protein
VLDAPWLCVSLLFPLAYKYYFYRTKYSTVAGKQRSPLADILPILNVTGFLISPNGERGELYKRDNHHFHFIPYSLHRTRLLLAFVSWTVEG